MSDKTIVRLLPVGRTKAYNLNIGYYTELRHMSVKPFIFPIVTTIALAGILASCREEAMPVTHLSTTTTAFTNLATTTHTITNTPNLVFEGYFTAAFEVSVFHPCSMKVTQEYVERFGYRDLGYWLKASPESGFREQFEAIHSQVGTITRQDERAPITVFVRFAGELSPTVTEIGLGYGHMGLYTNEIRVSEVFEMKMLTDGQCPD